MWVNVYKTEEGYRIVGDKCETKKLAFSSKTRPPPFKYECTIKVPKGRTCNQLIRILNFPDAGGLIPNLQPGEPTT